MSLKLHGGIVYIASAVCAFGAILLQGCGLGETENYGVYPPPGVMRVSTVAELEGPEENRLIQNGSFEDWLAGAPAPHGDFTAPTSNPPRSTIAIERETVARGEQALRQTWTQSDWGESLNRLFGVSLTTLKSNTRYHFKAQVNTLGSATGYLVIAQRQSSGAFLPIGEIELEAHPGFRDYEIVFDAGSAAELRIATLGAADPTAYPMAVVFDAWALAETQEPVTPSPAQAGESGLIPNGTFETWPVGALQPPGPFQAPQRHGFIARESRDVGNGRYALRHTWTQRNSIWDDAILFGLRLNLKPMTRYRLSLKAKTIGESSAFVEAHNLEADGRHLPIAANLIQVSPHPDWRDYQGEFATGALSSTALRAICLRMGEGLETNTILWDDWHLEELGPREELPVPDPPPGSLIRNGSFELWYAGRPVPEGDFMPPSEALAHSKLAPVLRTATEGIASMRQSWTALDVRDEGAALFGVQVAGLKPNTRYRFSCMRYPFGRTAQQAYVYGVATGGRLLRIARLNLGDPTNLHAWEECADEFTPGSYTAVKIAVVGPEAPSAYPFEVLWDDWKLEEL